jgi:uncharacterized protein YkwD
MTPRRPRWVAVVAVLALLIAVANALTLHARGTGGANTASATNRSELAAAAAIREPTTLVPALPAVTTPLPATTPPTVASTTTTVAERPVVPDSSTGTMPDQALDLQLVNQTRANAGVHPVSWDPNTSAQSWADHLAATHSEGDDPGFANGPGCGHAGNFAAASSVVEAHNALVASPPHYANMTGDYATVGIGVSRDSNFTYVVEDYTRTC